MSTIKDSVFEEEVRTAHLDEAHTGDIQGAWGTICASDTAPRKTWVARGAARSTMSRKAPSRIG